MNTRRFFYVVAIFLSTVFLGPLAAIADGADQPTCATLEACQAENALLRQAVEDSGGNVDEVLAPLTPTPEPQVLVVGEDIKLNLPMTGSTTPAPEDVQAYIDMRLTEMYAIASNMISDPKQLARVQNMWNGGGDMGVETFLNDFVDVETGYDLLQSDLDRYLQGSSDYLVPVSAPTLYEMVLQVPGAPQLISGQK